MSTRKPLFILLLIASITGVDQLTKLIATTILKGIPPKIYLNGMVRFEYVQNKGAFLSLGATMPADARFWLLTVAVAGTLALLIVMILRQKTNPLTTVGLSLLAGGGIGNLIDRIRWGSVIDFANVGIGPLRTGVFNVADMAIMAGVGLMLMDMFRSQNKST